MFPLCHKHDMQLSGSPTTPFSITAQSDLNSFAHCEMWPTWNYQIRNITISHFVFELNALIAYYWRKMLKTNARQFRYIEKRIIKRNNLIFLFLWTTTLEGKKSRKYCSLFQAWFKSFSIIWNFLNLFYSIHVDFYYPLNLI